MKVNATVGGRTLALEVTRAGGAYEVRLDGRALPLSIAGDGALRTIRIGGRAVETAAWRSPVLSDAGRGVRTYEVAVAGRVLEVTLADPLRGSGAAAPAARDGGGAAVRALMPGKVVAVLVGKGRDVRRGEGLVVVEAMKMENEIAAPRDGRVRDVAVRPGDAVETGQVLVVLEPEDGA